MAELPEVRRVQLPERRPLYDRPAVFGVARDAERMREGIAPPPMHRAPSRTGRWAPPDVVRDHPLDHPFWRCRSRARERPLCGRTWAHLRHAWSSRENRPSDVWHRLRCRRGHHEFSGGTSVQLGSSVVHVARRCVWCDAPPF